MRIVGAALLVAGIVLGYFGYISSTSLENSLSTTFLGHLTEPTMWYIAGGIVSGVFGILLLSGRLGGSKS